VRNRCFTSVLTLIILVATGTILFAVSVVPSGAEAEGAYSRADAVVIVNSASPSYLDFQHYIRPFLDHFGVPYTLLDIRDSPVTAAISDYALVVIGHRQLDLPHTYLDATEEGFISSAVNFGVGMVNFDNDLSADGVSPRYQFINDVFGFGYGGATSGSGVSFPSGTLHYIAERHSPGEVISTGQMALPGVTLPGGVTVVASTGAQPFIAVTSTGAGRAVQGAVMPGCPQQCMARCTDWMTWCGAAWSGRRGSPSSCRVCRPS
jgi:hypothetical protein